MITLISESIFRWLEKEDILPEDKHSLYFYAAYSMIFGTLPFIIITVLGIAFDMLKEGLLMVLTFMAVRKFSGGVHLKSARCCVFFSVFLLAISLRIIKLICYTGQINILSYLVITSVLIIWSFSPIDNAARRLTPKEKKVFKLIAVVLSTTATIFYFSLQTMEHIQAAVPIGVGIVLTACLLLPCIIADCFAKIKMLVKD